MSGCIDETGNTYGKLTVLERAGSSPSGKAMWLCQCDCGKTTGVSGATLRNGHTKSCGCRHGGLLPKGKAAFNFLLYSTKQGAKKRSLSFSLTDKQIRELHQQPCHYCGVKPSNIVSVQKLNGAYTYSGIDRLDNKKGYEIDNCVACCKVCNRAKSNMSLPEWEEWSLRFANFIGLAQEHNANLRNCLECVKEQYNTSSTTKALT